ncbi:MAG: hypothetical protein ABL940_08575 [Bacteroidia bacterium]
MKTIFCTTIMCINATCGINAITINEALAKKLISVKANWKAANEQERETDRYGKNMCVNIKNISKANIDVSIPSGYVFETSVPQHQNMMITENITYTLAPKQEQTKYAYSYCCESTDACPSENESYLPSKKTTTKLTLLAQHINQKKYTGYTVQRSVWAISNNAPVQNIYGTDSVQSNDLLYFVGELNNIPVADLKAMSIKNSLRKNNGDNGSYDFTLPLNFDVAKNASYWIVVHDVNNYNCKVLMQKKKLQKGVFNQTFYLSSIDLGTGNFVVRVYSDSEQTVIEKKFKLRV